MKDGWKYIIYNIKGEKKEQLFNLNEDPWEMVNLAEMPAYAFLKNAYKRLLKEEMKRTMISVIWMISIGGVNQE